MIINAENNGSFKQVGSQVAITLKERRLRGDETMIFLWACDGYWEREDFHPLVYWQFCQYINCVCVYTHNINIIVYHYIPITR